MIAPTVIGIAALGIISAIYRNVWIDEERKAATATDEAWVKGRQMVKHPKY